MTGDTLKLVGRTIADKYAVESVVGEGGFATVYRAKHLLWKRPVALKVFKGFGDMAEKDRERLLEEFVQEGALLADLSERTAAIVQARDVAIWRSDSGEHVPYMVLEWLDGATLEAVLHDEKGRGLPPRTVEQVVKLLDPAAEALALAHRKGIAHRDVKPGNLFVLGDPRGGATVKLLDFGIAKVVSDAHRMAGGFTKTSGSVTSFTPAYGAPEQFSRTHGATGPWTDVFALALVVVEAATGKEALQGDDFLQLGTSSASPTHRPTPRALGATVSDEVEAIFARALAVKPGDRFQTAGDFWSALRDAFRMDPMRGMTDPLPQPSVGAGVETARTVAVPGMHPESATAPPAAATQQVASRGGGRGWVPIAAAAAVLVLGGGAFLAYVGSRTEAPSAASPPEAPNAAAMAAVRGTGAAPSSRAPSAFGAPSASGAPSVSVAKATDPCPKGMLRIPGGSFFMGSDEGTAREKPAHQVVLAPYCIDEYEVTVERYKACSDGGRCKRAGTTNEWDGITEKDQKAFDPLCNVRDPEGHARHPINCVDWEMAAKFCSEQGNGGRLPTEAEWEFAARGPDGRKYPWGDDDPSAGFMNACGKECVAWGVKNGVDEKPMYAEDDGFPNTAPVGSFPKGASRYGLQDVVGNVWEWVADWYGDYGKDEQKAPTGPAEGTERVIRGGAWNGSYASWVRPTFRYKDSPSKRSYGIGFRCAK